MSEGFSEDILEGIRAIVREEVRSALGPAAAARGEDERVVVLSGDVHHFRLPEVLQLVSLQRLTGRLSMKHERQSVDIYVRRGQVSFATGEKRVSKEQLGSFLVNMGRISKAGLEQVLERCAAKGERLGKTLIEDGLVSREDIKSVLNRQTERSVYRAMAWESGRFAFELCEMPDFVEDIPISIRVEDLILEGVRRIEEGRVISEKIPSLDMVFMRPDYSADEVENMSLKGDERLVLGLIDGRKDLRTMIGSSGLAEFSFLRAVYALYSAGIIRKREPALRADRTGYL